MGKTRQLSSMLARIDVVQVL